MSDKRELPWEQRDLVNGTWREPGIEVDVWLCNPSTGEEVERQRATQPGTVEEAIAVADGIDRLGAWRNSPIEDRARLLENAADRLDALTEEIAQAEAFGSGVVISVTRLFAGSLGSAFRDAAHRLRSGCTIVDLSDGERPVELHRLPWGPTLILVPWNAPAGIAAKKIAYALAVGAPVILKANEWAPYGCNLLAVALSQTDLPAGVFQLVHGGPEVGRKLVSDPRIRAISFTGSMAAGADIAEAAARNFTAIQLELSGNNPVMVMPDAQIRPTADALCAGVTKLNGQWCEAPRKVFVPENMVEQLRDALIDALAGVRLGAHDDPEAELGPLAHERHRTRVAGQIAKLEELGAEISLVGTALDLGGWFFAPRIVSGVPGSSCVEEIFGPVLTLHSYSSLADAIDEANEAPDGLAAYAFGSDERAAMQVGTQLRFGEVKINGTSLLDLSPRSTQSFWRKSGIGCHGDDEVFAFFCGSQIVGVDRQGLPI